MKSLSVIILAAGSGTRMASNKPKVLHELGGKTLLDHVIDAVLPLHPEQLFVIYGHMGEVVLDAMQHRQNQITWVEQKQRLGTGHAVQQVLPLLNLDNNTLILCGDVPLISTATLQHLIDGTQKNQLGLITAHLKNPTGLGRIIRDPYQQVQGIIEEKDASDVQKQITEINTGIYCIPTILLQKWLPKLTNQNNQ
ncbi:MAG: NTP transferase domain-containing protein, partial [Gammaproteobacteria bacterium]|nr:NTP transferase domain-containing protein [Gammaproteobacteria bacterium]